MLMLPPSVRVYIATEAMDMRRSFDGLCAAVREVIGAAPYSGHLFVFRNKRADRVKILFWDRSGFAIWYKRLERGTFQWPAKPGRGGEIDSATLGLILEGIELESVKRRTRYRRAA